MARVPKPDFVFRRNVRVHLNRRGRKFSRLLAAEVCTSAVVMLGTPCSEVVWRVLATHSVRQFPLHFPSGASPCAITFHLDSISAFESVACLSVCYEPEVLTQKSATGADFEPEHCSLYRPSYFASWRFGLIALRKHSDLPSGFFFPGFLTRVYPSFLVFAVHATRPAFLMLADRRHRHVFIFLTLVCKV